MKIDKHFEKIKEVFEQSCKKHEKLMNWNNQEQVLGINEDAKTENGKKEVRVMKLKKLKRFLDDVAYICGLVFIYYERYLTNGIVDSRT